MPGNRKTTYPDCDAGGSETTQVVEKNDTDFPVAFGQNAKVIQPLPNAGVTPGGARETLPGCRGTPVMRLCSSPKSASTSPEGPSLRSRPPEPSTTAPLSIRCTWDRGRSPPGVNTRSSGMFALPSLSLRDWMGSAAVPAGMPAGQCAV